MPEKGQRWKRYRDLKVVIISEVTEGRVVWHPEGKPYKTSETGIDYFTRLYRQIEEN